jgi:uncharacterized protein (DUF433 family)
MLDWARCDAVQRDPDRVGGAWTFRGTRVPVRALFEKLEGGATVEQFLEWFPGVTRRQVEAVLEHAAKSLTAASSSRRVSQSASLWRSQSSWITRRNVGSAIEWPL